MKQILYFNQERERESLSSVCFVSDEEAIDNFYYFLKARVMKSFGIGGPEAVNLIESLTDTIDGAVSYKIHGDTAYAIIRHGGYSEYISLVDVYGLPESDKLEVSTKAGRIKAYKSADPGQPGICLMLQPADKDCEIDLAYASVYEDPDYRTSDNEGPEDVCIMTYADPYSEDYTSKALLRRDDVVKALTDC